MAAPDRMIRKRPATKLRDIHLKTLEISPACLCGGDTYETL